MTDNTYHCNDIIAEKIITASLGSASRRLNRNTQEKRLKHDRKQHLGNVSLLQQKLTIGDLVKPEDYDRARDTIDNLNQQVLEIERRIGA